MKDKFIYQKYDYKLKKGNLEISFVFTIGPRIKFRPKIKIKNVGRLKLEKEVIDNFVFHLGLMEIPSYWKCTCSPEIIIKAGYLNREQIKWWQDLVIKGMGQFFYENKINFKKQNFLKICLRPDLKHFQAFKGKFRNRYLVPVGGGKDSIVTLEVLKKQRKKIGCFIVNPTKSAKNVLKVAKIKKTIIVERKIDPALLKLNKKGYFNGHTPFTAVLSFLSVFCAVLFDYKNIAFSNEKSADEGNVRYLGRVINHQYSKSSEFERKFKTYCQKYLVKNVNYFSYLRKYTELEISKMFSKYPKYFSVFSSCNVASKMGERWCLNCSKCLFVYAILYPFLKREQLLKIFGKDLFENKKLLPIMKALIGQGGQKPFECVGTFKESRLAFNLSLKKAKKLPFLLQKFNEIRRIKR